MRITAKKVLRYTLLPEIIPQVRRLFSSGFGQIAYFMAQIYGTVRLLPVGHPYLNAANIGRFGIVSVMLAAYANLRFTRKNIDQIFIFVLLGTGLVLLLAQFALFGFALFVQTSQAATGGFAGFFVTPDPTNDIAHILMDRVFGIPGMFNSCVSQGIPCLTSTMPEGPFPFPYHAAFQDMLAFYSIGLCVIAVIIFLYYIVTIVVETAQTGTAFGKRFNRVWAPIRMVVALALLVPLTYGLNGAQLLTLNAAKWGSALATNGWVLFVDTLTSASTTPVGGSVDQLVGQPEKPNPESLFQFFTVVSTCTKAYKRIDPPIEIKAYFVRSGAAPNNMKEMAAGTKWEDARQFYENGDIVVVFGEHSLSKYPKDKGNVRPWCGELLLKQIDLYQPGSVSAMNSYFDKFIMDYWMNASTGSPSLGVAANTQSNNTPEDFFFNAADRILDVSMNHSVDGKPPASLAKNALLTTWTSNLDMAIVTAVTAQINADGWVNNLRNYGWGGAGIWYNRIAELNGAMIAGIANIPEVRRWPLVMEAVSDEKGKSDQQVPFPERFKPYFTDGRAALPAGMNLEIARALNLAYVSWLDGNAQAVDGQGESIPIFSSKNVLIDFVKELFGLKGLYNMRENANVHPLAQLVITGKYLLEASIRNIAGSAMTSVLAKVVGATDFPGGPEIVQAFGSLLRTVGMTTLSLGFVLYYVLPFLPFMYFFFQLGGWIKALFEAMVGLPLWALAHIRIDGEGLPGSAGMNGYFLIFEIFLRPILTIFGMIAGISIFAAQVQVLNDIFTIVVSNLTGFNAEVAGNAPAYQQVQGTSAVVPDPEALTATFQMARSVIDQLFYTVIYVIIVYMMGMASFKLVYMIPDNMLRWMGSSVDGFGEIAKSTPEGLIGKMYGGSVTITGQVSGAFRNLMMRGGGK